MMNFGADSINITKNDNESAHHHVIFNKPTYIAILFISSSVIIAGVLVNVFFILNYVTKRIQQSDFNLSMVHLSASNICQHIGCLPYLWIKLRHFDETDSSFVYKDLIPGITCGVSLFFCFAFVSVWILSYVTIKRCVAILFPIQTYKQKRRGKHLVLSVIWMIAILWIVPHHLSWKIIPHEEVCERRSDLFSKTFLKVYGSLMFVLGLLVPIVTMVISLIIIKRRMQKESKRFDERSEVKRFKHRQKVISSLLVLVFVFCGSWAPWAVYWIIRILNTFNGDIKTEYLLARLRKVLILPCLLAGILNPICCSREIRRSIASILMCKSRKTHSTQTNATLRSRRSVSLYHQDGSAIIQNQACWSISQVTRERGITESTIASSLEKYSQNQLKEYV